MLAESREDEHRFPGAGAEIPAKFPVLSRNSWAEPKPRGVASAGRGIRFGVPCLEHGTPRRTCCWQCKALGRASATAICEHLRRRADCVRCLVSNSGGSSLCQVCLARRRECKCKSASEWAPQPESARGGVQNKVGIAEPSAPPPISRTGTPAGAVIQPAFVWTRRRAALLTELELLRQQLRFLRGFGAEAARCAGADAKGFIEALAMPGEAAPLPATAQEQAHMSPEPDALPPPFTRARARALLLEELQEIQSQLGPASRTRSQRPCITVPARCQRAIGETALPVHVVWGKGCFNPKCQCKVDASGIEEKPLTLMCQQVFIDLARDLIKSEEFRVDSPYYRFYPASLQAVREIGLVDRQGKESH